MTISHASKNYSMSSLFGSFLWGRHMAVALRDRILEDGPIAAKIDFTGVEFITRAFADEFVKVKHFLAVKGIKVQEQKAGVEVAKMLNYVVNARDAKQSAGASQR